MLAKIRHYVDQSTLRSIYFSIFSSILKYGCQIWGQDQIIKSNLRRIMKVQNKALRIINFADFIPSSPLYKTSNILKLKDHVTLNNFLYVHDSFTSNIPSSLRYIGRYDTSSDKTDIIKFNDFVATQKYLNLLYL